MMLLEDSERCLIQNTAPVAWKLRNFLGRRIRPEFSLFLLGASMAFRLFEQFLGRFVLLLFRLRDSHPLIMTEPVEKVGSSESLESCQNTNDTFGRIYLPL
jgi:hypothetical protein